MKKPCNVKPHLIPYGVYNINSSVKGNGTALDDDHLIYASGNLIISFNTTSKMSSLLKCMKLEGVTINILEIDLSRKILAVSQKGTRAVLSVMSLEKYRKDFKLKDMCIFSGCTKNSKEYTCLKISSDSTYVGAITGRPDWLLVIYNISNGYIVFNISFTFNLEKKFLTDLAFNPDDSSQVAVVGDGIFRIYRFCQSKEYWNVLGYIKIINLSPITVSWMSGDRILAGTEDGRLIAVVNGKLCGIYNTLTDDIIFHNKFQSAIISQSISKYDYFGVEAFKFAVISVIELFNGFLLYCKCGHFFVFEEIKDGWFKRREDYGLELNVVLDCENQSSNAICYSARSGLIAVTVNSFEIVLLKLCEYKIELKELLSFMVHSGSLSSLSSSKMKPLLLSTGLSDRAVVLWDYKLSFPLNYWLFRENVIHAALHPSGMFCLLLFSNKFAFGYIDLNGRCLEVLDFCEHSVYVGVFAESGGFFAVGNETSITIYSTIRLEKKNTIFTDRGFALSSLYFYENDRYVCACNVKGNIKKWHIYSSKASWDLREVVNGEYCTMAKPNKTYVYIVSNNGELVEIKDGLINNKVNIHLGEVNCISEAGNVVVLGGKKGSIYFLWKPISSMDKVHDFFIGDYDIDKVLFLTEINICMATKNGGLYLCAFFIDTSQRTRKLENYDYSYLSKVSILNADKTIPRNIIALKNFRSELLNNEFQHKLDDSQEQDNVLIIRHILGSINDVLTDLFLMKALTFFYQKRMKTFEWHANKYDEINTFFKEEINNFYEKKILRMIACAIGNKGVGKLIQPLDLLMKFINKKFALLYNITKKSIRRAISKALKKSQNKIQEVSIKIQILKKFISKYYYLSNNPSNYIRFLVSSIFHKYHSRSELIKNYNSYINWRMGMFGIKRLEEELIYRLISQEAQSNEIHRAKICKQAYRNKRTLD